jgi:DnaK suppressor protein
MVKCLQGSKFLEAAERNSIEKLTESLIGNLEREIEYLKELTRPISPDNAIGRLSRMEAIGEKAVNEEALRLAELRLPLLKSCLSRIQLEKYGTCESCDDEIAMARLKIYPESRVCMDCLREAQAEV